MMKFDTIQEYISEAIVRNWEQPSLCDIDGVVYSYKDVARKITKLHILFDECDVRPGDKVAICGKNSAQWGVAFIGALSYGAVVVPLLHEFKPESIHYLVTHSDAKLLFVDEGIWKHLNPDDMPLLEGVLLNRDFELAFSRSEVLTCIRENLNKRFGELYPKRFVASDLHIEGRDPEQLAIINYTSGTTGFSKGVMLSYKNLWSNLQFCLDHLDDLQGGDAVICMLPLAHMYGLMVELLHPFAKGCSINFLSRTPSPHVLMDAFARVRPKIIVSVPLIIEKIIKTRVFPIIERPLMKILLHVPFVDSRILDRIKDSLNAAFGGNLKDMIIGGAALNRDVEVFLRRINFPFTVGYGMTECAPLISYAPWDETKAGSCGRVVDRMELEIDSENPVDVPGVIRVRGDNVMMGYYKNAEATKEVLDGQGWLTTGDMGCVDRDGFVSIRGRVKNMILGASGQNIYPEEIEQSLNNMPYVAECLIVSRNGKLVALIHPDYANAQAAGLDDAAILQQMSENIAALNQMQPAYARVVSYDVMDSEFEKTPKRSIKRYLYN